MDEFYQGKNFRLPKFKTKIRGPDSVVEIDESLICGKIKNHRGRLLIGDILDGNPEHNSRPQNYGDQVNGPWAFGIIERGTRRTRLFYVEYRKRVTLYQHIFANVEKSSTICSDQWAAYATLGDFFATHNWVNHSENFIDPNDSSIHTQTVERVWREAKALLLVKFRGVPLVHLQSHLDFFSFLYEFKYDDPFVVFMKILGKKFE